MTLATIRYMRDYKKLKNLWESKKAPEDMEINNNFWKNKKS